MNTSKMLIMSYMGDHVWLMTSRQTEPDLYISQQLSQFRCNKALVIGIWYVAHSSSMFGWKMRFTKPMLGLL